MSRRDELMKKNANIRSTADISDKMLDRIIGQDLAKGHLLTVSV